MDYAVVRVGGKQYKVCRGDILEVDKQEIEENSSLALDDVLLWVSDGKVRVGRPKVGNVKISAKVLEQKKGKKIRVAKFKAKVRYRRVMGFRPRLSRLQITDIEPSENRGNSRVSAVKTVTKIPVKHAVKKISA